MGVGSGSGSYPISSLEAKECLEFAQMMARRDEEKRKTCTHDQLHRDLLSPIFFQCRDCGQRFASINFTL